MSAAPLTVRESLVAQAWSCSAIGSALYGSLLTGLIDDYDRHGVTQSMLDGVSERPQHDALPLRYLACAHRLALAGHAPDLARHYPSCGGVWDGSQDVLSDFLATVHRFSDEFRSGVCRNVQTNEVGRAAVLASGFELIGQRYRLPLDQLEIGSSAGLLSCWDHYRYESATTTWGAESSSLSFGPDWWCTPPPQLARRGTTKSFDVTVCRRRASDIVPIDIHTDSGRTTSMSFVWPDQMQRFERLHTAIDIASHVPMSIEQADAGDWLAAQLSSRLREGAATVVFHSIVWQYLPQPTQAAVRGAIERAGATSTDDSPLLWLRMEPATRDHADLQLMSFPFGNDEILAHVGYHGRDIVWLSNE